MTVFEEYNELIRLTIQYIEQEFKSFDQISLSLTDRSRFFTKPSTAPAVQNLNKQPPPSKNTYAAVEQATPAPQQELQKKHENREEIELKRFENKTMMDLEDVKNTMKGLLPSISLTKEKQAVEPVCVIILPIVTAGKTFLDNLAKSLKICFGPTKVLAANPLDFRQLQNQTLKLILSTEDIVKTHSSFIKKDDRFFFESIPVVLLADASLYLKEPSLKKSLWNEIKAAIQ